MIIGSWRKLVVGSIDSKILDTLYNIQNQPFKVMREASYDEWANQDNIKGTLTESQVSAAKDGYFYEISVD